MKTPKKRRAPPSQKEFASLVVDRLREAGVPGDIVYDPDKFQVTVASEGNGKTAVLHLGNGYRDYCSISEEDRPEALRRYLGAILDAYKTTPEDFADVQSNLLPAVRARSYYELSRLETVIGGNDTAYWPYQLVGDDLGLGLVYDLPNTMRSIINTELEGWGITLDEGLAVARQNLSQLQPEITVLNEGEGVYVFATNDGYDSSRLILLDLIRQFQVKGEYIAMVPRLESLIVTGSEDEPGLKAMVALAKDALQKERRLSGIAHRLKGDSWVSWMPAPDHPLHDAFRLLRLYTFDFDYAEQTKLLETFQEKTGADAFVAPFTLIRHDETGQHMTYCTWQQGVRSLLPRTERIVLGANNRPQVLVSWEKVVEVAGDLLRPVSIYPERYLVEGFPTAEQLAAMGNEWEEK